MKENFASSEIRKMMYGIDTLVELNNGTKVPAVNFDNAATTPPFIGVVEAIQESLKYYGSIGRGTGQKSKASTDKYWEARRTVLKFVNALEYNGDDFDDIYMILDDERNRYTAFFTNCATDGMNKLASALIKSSEDIVMTTRMEHHANDMPWRERGRAVFAEVDENGRLIVDEVDENGLPVIGSVEQVLRMYNHKIKYVAVTAASNVTGYVNDIHKIAKIAHKYGAKIIVDAAQIIAHREISMLGKTEDENIDFLVFSAHKMYSPYGGGAVVGLKSELNKHVPCLYGGGMIETVTDDGVFYAPAPDLYEAGSPNFPGVVGMAKAMDILKKFGFDFVVAHEQKLMKLTIDKLSQIPRVKLYGDNENITDRVGLITFTIDGIENQDVAEELAGYSAIAVRQAAFCAHPYVRRLTKVDVRYDKKGLPLYPIGLIRVSFGIYNDENDVNCLVQAVKDIIARPRDKFMISNNFAAIYPTAYEQMSRIPGDRG